jgi:hypothetical protein
MPLAPLKRAGRPKKEKVDATTWSIEYAKSQCAEYLRLSKRVATVEPLKRTMAQTRKHLKSFMDAKNIGELTLPDQKHVMVREFTSPKPTWKRDEVREVMAHHLSELDVERVTAAIDASMEEAAKSRVKSRVSLAARNGGQDGDDDDDDPRDHDDGHDDNDDGDDDGGTDPTRRMEEIMNYVSSASREINSRYAPAV